MKLDVGALSLIGPMFVDVNTDAASLKLGSVVPNENYDIENGTDLLQSFNPDGSIKWSVAYYGAEWGWYDGDQEADGYDINIGTGFLANTKSIGVSYCIAGEVRTDATDIPVAPGITIIANSLPMPITLGQIVPNANFDTEDGRDFLQCLDSNGILKWSVAYYGSEWGWFDGDNEADLYDIDAGDGLVATIDSSSVVLSLPALVIAD